MISTHIAGLLASVASSGSAGGEPPAPPLPTITSDKWRLVILSPVRRETSWVHCGIGTIRFYDGNNDPIMLDALGFTATTTSTWGPPASNVFNDDETDALSMPTNGVTQTVAVTVNSPIAVSGFSISATNEPQYAVGKHQMQYYDGSTWIDFFGVIDDCQDATNTLPYAYDVRHFSPAWRRWRIYWGSAANGHSGLNGMQFRDVAGVAKFATGGYALAKDRYGENSEKTGPWDNDDTTGWGMSTIGWLEYVHAPLSDNKTPFDCVEVAIMAQNSSPYGDNQAAPNSFDIKHSDDGGATWITDASYTGLANWSSLEVRTYAV